MESAQRKIVAALSVTMIFAVVGEYSGQSKSRTPPDPFRVILGGAIGAGLLVGISELGPAGERFAVGLSVVAVLSATLVYGGPVWATISKAVASQGSGGTPTAPTAPTAPTSGFATATALAPAVASTI
jgi:hypothetical protein